ncbi:MAG: chorismate-binding protein [Flavobacteriales bacterium]|nr:chorismate-binding protein [Flavobacteriales bacterium]
MRSFQTFPIKDPVHLVPKVLAWAGKQDANIALLNSNGYPNSSQSLLVAIGVHEAFTADAAFDGNLLEALRAFQRRHSDWMFGFLSYDVKNHIEHLVSQKPQPAGFPLAYFFVPQVLIRLNGDQVEVAMHPDDPRHAASVWKEVENMHALEPQWPEGLAFRQRMTENEYKKRAEQILGHIRRGDIYEMNFCQEFYATDAGLDPDLAYLHLARHFPSPFSCYFRCGEQFVLSASPERYLKKSGSELISQPMKGTIGRGRDAGEDRRQIDLLRGNPKEQSENVMIVDLVRNDLSRIAEKGSVSVSELFGIQTFPKVHQMVSTVRATLRSGVDFWDCVKASFPMGSMTGAPKIRSMELIDTFEQVSRGLYSGTIGYLTLEGDFDFNVVIRTLLYNRQNQYLSLHTGSAITSRAVPEDEYRECLLKAHSVLTSSQLSNPISPMN